MSLAAIAAGADGLIIEVHNDPARALCDGGHEHIAASARFFNKFVQRLVQHVTLSLLQIL